MRSTSADPRYALRPESGKMRAGVPMLVLSLTAWMSDAHAGDDGPKHQVAVRFRQGTVPRTIIDNFYFDAEELPAELNFVRPDVNTRVLGLDYTLGLNRDNAGLVFWGERFSTPIEAGLWDDREEPPDHSDAEWFDPQNLGAWAVGLNFVYNVPIVTTVPQFELKLGIGAGVGAGMVTGITEVWKDGRHDDLGDPSCLPDAPAPQRKDQCGSDGEVALPSVIPILDVTIGPRIRLFDKLLIRGDFGFHDSLYWGVAAGLAI